MAFKSMEEFVELLEKHNELVRITTYVDPVLEIAEITDRISKTPDRNKALLFENNGTPFPVLMNSMGSYKRICLALGVAELDDVAAQIETLFHTLTAPKATLLDKLKMIPTLGSISSWMPKTSTSRGACQEVVMPKPDIMQLPVLKCWPHDGGRFITLPAIHTKSLTTGQRNIGMYRVQLFEPTLASVHWHKHKVSAGHFNEYKTAGLKMPVAIVLGGDPSYIYGATAPLPPNVDEYMLAGFLRKQKVTMVRCLTQDIEVPADADIVIEGFVDPCDELIWEGPFGDHTGYYSLADWYPRFHVTAITHRKNAIYPATIVGIPPQEDAWLGKATERIFIAPIKMTMLPEIINMELPIEGVFHNLTIVSIEKQFAGHAQKVTNAMWGAGQMMFNKMLVIADKEVDLTNYMQLAKIISQNVDVKNDMLLAQGPMDVLDHACSKFAFGGKLSIDATLKYEEEVNHTAISDFALAKQQWNTATVIEIKNNFPEVIAINFELVHQDIAVIIVAIKKSKKGHIKAATKSLFALSVCKHIKAILFVEEVVDTTRLKDCVWRLSNNYDPKRDTYFIDAESDDEVNHVALDGTRKTKEYDGFEREWPNIIVAADATIAVVDSKWDSLGLGSLISSPSLPYKNQVYNDGAVAL